VAEAPARTRSVRLRPLAKLTPMVFRYPWHTVGALVALTVAALTTLAIPLAVRRMVDFGFSRDGVGMIDSYFAVLVLVAALLACASAARFYLMTTLGERVVADLRTRVFRHVVSLSPVFFDKAQTGEVVSRLSADTTQIKGAVGGSFSVALRNVLLFVGASLMMVWTSPRLSGFVLAAIPIIVLPLVAFGRMVQGRSRQAQDALANASAYASELIGGVRTVQAFTYERAADAHFSDAVERAFIAARGATRARAVLTAIAIFLVFASIVIVLWVGAQDVLGDRMTAGRLSQFVLYAVFAAGALSELSQTWNELAQASGSAERLFEILAVEPAVRPPAQPRPLAEPARGAVTLEAVRFAYPTRPEAFVLDGVSLSVAAGERVALVGPSGAGKSTIFHLLLRFYDPASGRITYDGVPINQVDPEALRRRIAARRFGGRHRTRGGPGARQRVRGAPAARTPHCHRRTWRDAVRRSAPARRDRARDPARCAAVAAG
jgi:ATP-binding cassette subfamily B protein